MRTLLVTMILAVPLISAAYTLLTAILLNRLRPAPITWVPESREEQRRAA